MEIRFHHRLYPVGVIKDCVVEFGEFGDFEINREGDHHVVSITNADPDYDKILHHEFGNFVLATAIEHKRAT